MEEIIYFLFLADLNILSQRKNAPFRVVLAIKLFIENGTCSESMF